MPISRQERDRAGTSRVRMIREKRISFQRVLWVMLSVELYLRFQNGTRERYHEILSDADISAPTSSSWGMG